MPLKECPQWVKTIKQSGDPQVGDTIWHAEFYPFLDQSCPLMAEKEAILAYTYQHSVVVARLSCKAADNSVSYIEICRFTDEDDIAAQPDAGQRNRESSIHRIAWSVNKLGEPMLCVIGRTRVVKVYNVARRSLDRVLIGMGAELSDIRIPRSHPNLVFTVGGDREVRVWNLNNKTRPCAAIFAGTGDQNTIHALDIHPSMKYFICGGADVTVNLWAIPPTINDYPKMPREPQHREKVARVMHPHFQTLDLHGDPIDCLQWWGDMILSRACRENKIILWKIDGFDSSDPVPHYPAAVESQVQRSRSAWGGRFQILFVFSYTPKTAWPGTMWNHFAFCQVYPEQKINKTESDEQAAIGSNSTSRKNTKKRKAEEMPGTAGPMLAHGGSNGYIHVWNMKRLKLSDIPGISAEDINNFSSNKTQQSHIVEEDANSAAIIQESRSSRTTRSKSVSVPRTLNKNQGLVSTVSNTSFGVLQVVKSNAKTPGDRRDVPVPDCRVCHLAWSPGGKFLVAAMELSTLCIYMRPE